MPAVFVSHSSKDREISGRVKDWLGSLGYEKVFLDFDTETGLGAGEQWERRLYQEIARCHAVIVVLTPAWIASKWCFAEFTNARGQGKVIIPLVCAPGGDTLIAPEIQNLDLREWNRAGLAHLEARLRAITDDIARGFAWSPGRPPYTGLESFEAEDAAIFFGRDQEARDVIAWLDAKRVQGGGQRLLLIHGTSGSGKSSLVKAGVLPQLGRDRRRWIALPPVRPERSPLSALAKALAMAEGKPQAGARWRERLGGPEAIEHVHALLDDLRQGDARQATAVLALDQFEEVFTLAAPAERQTFLALLATLCGRHRDLPLLMLATARSDLIFALFASEGFAIPYREHLLAAMPLERVARLVAEPAKVAALSLEEGLAEHIAKHVRRSEELPLFAFTLRDLFDRFGADRRLSITEYDSLGDPAKGLDPIANAVSRRSAETMAHLAPGDAEAKALRDAFVPHLVRVRPEEGLWLRRPAKLADLPNASHRLVEGFVAARLLTARGEAGSATIEVAHEALFTAWPLLAGWLAEEKEFLADLERLRAAHLIWLDAKEPDRPGSLLRGVLLTRGRDWRTRHPERFAKGDLAPLGAFIAASDAVVEAEARDRASREKRMKLWRRLVVAASVVAAIVAGAAAVLLKRGNDALNQSNTALKAQTQIAADKTREAEKETRAAEANQASALAALSTLALPASPVHAAKLALAAWPRDIKSLAPRLQVALDALGAAAPNLRERLNKSFPSSLSSAAFSPDGTRIVTFSYDRAARIWDVATGKEIAFLRANGGFVRGAFSPDGTRIAAASWDRTAGVWDAATGEEIAVLRGHEEDVRSASFSPDGRRIVTASDDETARVWDAATGKEILSLSGHEGGALSAAFSPDGTGVITVSRWGGADNKFARVWDAATGKEIVVLRGQDAIVFSAAFSPDGTRIVTTSGDEIAGVWDAATGRETATLRGHENKVRSAAFSPDGGRIVTASEDRTARIWDEATGKEIVVLRGHGAQVQTAAFSLDGRRIVTASDDKTARVWDAATGKEIAALRGHEAEVLSAVFSSDGTRALTTSEDMTVRVWDTATGREIAALRGQARVVSNATFSPDGTRIVTPSDDKTARVWDAATGKEIAGLDGHGDEVYDAAFSPDGTRIVTASADTTARVWEAGTGKEIVVLRGHEAIVSSASFSPDGTRIVTASADKTARVWDAATGKEIAALRGHEGPVWSPSFSPDGGRIVTNSWDKTVRVWSAATGKEIAALRQYGKLVRSAAFSPDGRRIVTAEDNFAVVWDAATGNEIAGLDGHGEDVFDAAFSPDGTRIVTASADKTARVWDAATGKEIAALRGHEEFVSSAAFSPDETRIVTASADKTARVWDAATGKEIVVLRAQDEGVLSAVFSPDGGRIVTASADKTVRIWDISTLPRGNLFQIACAWLPDHDLSDLAKDYHLTGIAPICEGNPPLPDPSP
jgi:WD40 repeat protein